MKTNGIYNGDLQRTAIAGSDEEVQEPVTVMEFKNWARIDVADDDLLIEALIGASRRQCEDFTSISFVPTFVEGSFLIQQGNYALPYGPVINISSFKYTCPDSQEITDYQKRGKHFISISGEYCDPLYISYEAGYTSETLPKDLKTAIMQQALYLYDNRGDESLMTNLGPVAVATLYPHRRVV